MKAPTSLKKLDELIEEVETRIENDPDYGGFNPDDLTTALGWLKFTLESLTNRKTYHKKQQLRRKMLMKVAKEQLSPDELESIDKQAGELAELAVAHEEDLELIAEGEGPNDHELHRP